MRHHLRLRVLLPALASLVAACGGGTESVDNGTTSGTTPTGGTSSSSSSGGTSSSGGASSSSGNASSSSGTVETFATNVCTPQKGYELAVGLTLASGIDSLEIFDHYDGDANSPSQSRGLAGTVCATAADKPKCTADVAAFTTTGWQLAGNGNAPSAHRYGVTTKAGAVAGIDDPANLKTAIAPIDSDKDAALLVAAKGDVYFDCETNNAVKTATGYDIKVSAGSTCGAGSKLYERIYAVTADGAVTMTSERLVKEGDPGCAIGRRPEGLVAQTSEPCADPVGRFFAEAAHLEAASVYSFERLAGELFDLGAPDELIEAAYSSREDEVRHARMTSKMAKRFGGKPVEPQVEELPARSKLAIALENATEGCVRETYGALVAHRQATDASDASIRCMMQVIAEDETKHAGLAWDVAGWLEPQLTTDERVIVEDARRRAIADLRRELAADVHPDLRTRAGMPDAATALALLDALDDRFIAAA